LRQSPFLLSHFTTETNRWLLRYMNAEKYGLDRIYFGGYFIRGSDISSGRKPSLTIPPAGHAATITTLSYAIRFWSKGTKRALFLRHEGFL
jgi:type II pantothenate kinase